MKQVNAFLMLCVLLCSCSKDSEPNPVSPWTQLTDFPGDSRRFGVSFSIDNSVYIGLGNNEKNYYKDFWKLDLSTNEWKQIKDPNVTAGGSLAFSLNGMGYLLPNLHIINGPGFQGTSDFWQYNPAADTWKKLKPYPGSVSSGGTSFVINNKGYVFVGSNFNDKEEIAELWEYEPATDEWKARAQLPLGPTRSFSSSFVSNGKAYLVGGATRSGTIYDDVWEYDPVANSWKEKGKFPGAARVVTVAFSIGEKGYIGIGSKALPSVITYATYEFWEYNSSLDSWRRLDDFPGHAYLHCYAASVGPNGFVIGGSQDDIFFNETWKFDPNAK